MFKGFITAAFLFEARWCVRFHDRWRGKKVIPCPANCPESVREGRGRCEPRHGRVLAPGAPRGVQAPPPECCRRWQQAGDCGAPSATSPGTISSLAAMPSARSASWAIFRASGFMARLNKVFFTPVSARKTPPSHAAPARGGKKSCRGVVPFGCKGGDDGVSCPVEVHAPLSTLPAFMDPASGAGAGRDSSTGEAAGGGGRGFFSRSPSAYRHMSPGGRMSAGRR